MGFKNVQGNNEVTAKTSGGHSYMLCKVKTMVAENPNTGLIIVQEYMLAKENRAKQI